MIGGAVDSPATGGGSGGQKNRSKQSILPVNVKQVRRTRNPRRGGARWCRRMLYSVGVH